jgi:hypothetical protein
LFVSHECVTNLSLNLHPLFSSLQIRELRYDDLFKDLFVATSDNSDTLLSSYLEQKLLKMGLTKEQLEVNFPSSLNLPRVLVDEKIDYSNTLNYKGDLLNVQNLTQNEKINLVLNLDFDQLNKYNNLECIRSETYISTPTRKLQYPEPFIASASFIHTDIGFIHILQYQYWLWFVFVFLIVFFFITYLSTIR